jgi:hypothetical protein
LEEITVKALSKCRVRAFCALSFGTILAFGSNSRATVIWNQSINGPLSELPSAPTPFTLSEGTNSIIAVVGGGNGTESGVDQNWVNINIPTGLQLSELVLASYTSTDLQGFTGVAAGTTFAPGEAGVNTEGNYLGYTHFGTGASNNGQPATNLVGVDVLPIMGNNVVDSPGSAGFTPPLPAGSYTFLIQQLGATTDYQYDFDVTSVPEPATDAILLIAPMILGFSRRRVQQ